MRNVYGMLIAWFTFVLNHILRTLLFKRSYCITAMLFSGSPIEALWTITQTMTMCSAFEHFMNGKGAI